MTTDIIKINSLSIIKIVDNTEISMIPTIITIKTINSIMMLLTKKEITIWLTIMTFEKIIDLKI